MWCLYVCNLCSSKMYNTKTFHLYWTVYEQHNPKCYTLKYRNSGKWSIFELLLTLLLLLLLIPSYILKNARITLDYYNLTLHQLTEQKTRTVNVWLCLIQRWIVLYHIDHSPGFDIWNMISSSSSWLMSSSEVKILIKNFLWVLREYLLSSSWAIFVLCWLSVGTLWTVSYLL